MKNAISWFEIPSTQLNAAQAFYEAVLVCTLRREPMGPSEGAVFPYDRDGWRGGRCCHGWAQCLPAQRHGHLGVSGCIPLSGRRFATRDRSRGPDCLASHGLAARHGFLCPHPGPGRQPRGPARPGVRPVPRRGAGGDGGGLAIIVPPCSFPPPPTGPALFVSGCVAWWRPCSSPNCRLLLLPCSSGMA